MDFEKIKELIDDMGNSKLTSIDIDFPDGTKISMKKDREILDNIKLNNKDNVEVKSEEKENLEKSIEEKGYIVKSPMIGTFYTKSSPTANPYVEIGKEVKKGDTLCIIEAMKLMNEIQSDYSGKITEIFIEDGSNVEYGTKLFRIE